jgi:hypothetical protein
MPVANAKKGNFGVSAIIEEDVRDMLRRGFGFADWVRGDEEPGSRSLQKASAA